MKLIDEILKFLDFVCDIKSNNSDLNGLIITASALRDRILKEKENKMETKQLVIRYDETPSDSIGKVNRLLEQYGLEFVWDGKDYDDYSERYDLVKIESGKE